jgi:hypothetical protein
MIDKIEKEKKAEKQEEGEEKEQEEKKKRSIRQYFIGSFHIDIVVIRTTFSSCKLKSIVHSDAYIIDIISSFGDSLYHVPFTIMKQFSKLWSK